MSTRRLGGLYVSFGTERGERFEQSLGDFDTGNEVWPDVMVVLRSAG